MAAARGHQDSALDLRKIFFFLFCGWKAAWSICYKPINETERLQIDNDLKKCRLDWLLKKPMQTNDNMPEYEDFRKINGILHLPPQCVADFDDEWITKSINMAQLKMQLTRNYFSDFQCLTKNVLDQKDTNLCVPISISVLLRFAIKDFAMKSAGDKRALENIDKIFSIEKILTVMVMHVYPRSLAGLNANPNNEEKENQLCSIDMLIERLCAPTYSDLSGWEIIRDYIQDYYSSDSGFFTGTYCSFKEGLFNASVNITVF